MDHIWCGKTNGLWEVTVCSSKEKFNYEVRLDQRQSIQYAYCCMSTATIYEQTNFLVKLIYMNTMIGHQAQKIYNSTRPKHKDKRILLYVKLLPSEGLRFQIQLKIWSSGSFQSGLWTHQSCCYLWAFMSLSRSLHKLTSNTCKWYNKLFSMIQNK